MTGNSPRDCRKFFKSMTSEDVVRYAGQWIAVASGEIVAHGKDPGRFLDEGRRAGKGHPYMRYMYAGPEEVPFFYRPPRPIPASLPRRCGAAGPRQYPARQEPRAAAAHDG